MGDRNPAGAGQLVRAGVAAAALLRRRQQASRRVWRIAPGLAAGCLALAALGRSLQWSATLALAALVLTALALVALRYTGRGSMISDSVAAAIDAESELDGELRSATWFAGREQRDSWAEHHVGRAAARLRGISWTQLYPPIHARRAQLVTGALILGTLALSMMGLPAGRVWPASTLATAAAARTNREPARSSVGIAELQQQLEALLTAAETGAPLRWGGTQASVADQRLLISGLKASREAGKLKDLAHAMAPPTPAGRANGPAAEIKALAARIQDAAHMPDVAPDVRQTLEEALEMVSEDGGRMPSSQEQPQQPGSSRDRKGEMVRANGRGEVDENTIQAVREAAPAAGVGTVIMQGGDDAAKKATPGLGLGGGPDKPTDGGTMAALEAALRRETIDAGMDSAGQTIQTEARRKTEPGTASVPYAHSVEATFDRGQAVAPPAVPEGRRTAVQSYFIRKQ